MRDWEALVGTPFEKESIDDSGSQSSLPDNDGSHTANGDGGVSDNSPAGTEGKFMGAFNKMRVGEPKVGGGGFSHNPPATQGRFQGYFNGGQGKTPKSLSSGC